MFETLQGDADVVMNTKTGKDPFVAVQPVSFEKLTNSHKCIVVFGQHFRIDSDGIANYKDLKFITSKGACCCDTLRSGGIS